MTKSHCTPLATILLVASVACRTDAEVGGPGFGSGTVSTGGGPGSTSGEPGSTSGAHESGEATSGAESTSDADSSADDSSTTELKFDTPTQETEGGGGMYCGKELDILFTMDVSTSMGKFFDKLEQSILEIDTEIQKLDLPTPPRYGLVVFVDDVKVVNTGTYADLAMLKADFAMWNDFTANNRQINDAGKQNTTMPENSLDALYAGAAEFEWRPADVADRIIIHTTDNTFWNGPMVTQEGVMVDHGYAETVDVLQANQIRTFVFAASEDCTIMINGMCSGGAEVGAGWFTPYQGQPSIPQATDGSVWEIQDVYQGKISLSVVIPAAVEEKYCDPYPEG